VCYDANLLGDTPLLFDTISRSEVEGSGDYWKPPFPVETEDRFPIF